MTVDLVLYNGKICIDDMFVTAGVAIDNGRIVKVAKKTNLPAASEKVDVNGCLILPGLIDVHTHLRDQRQAYEEDFFTGTAAAAAGGVTLCLDMPNNEPVTMNSKSLKERMRIAADKVLVNVGFYSAFPEESTEIPQIAEDGAVAFKLFLTKQIGGVDIDDDDVLENAFQHAEKSGVPVAIHAEDKELLDNAVRSLRQAKRNDVGAYLDAHSPMVEEEAVNRMLRLVEKTKVHAHFCHVSSKLGLSAALEAKRAGLPVSCEVTAHHLLLSAADLRRYETIALSDPPVRGEEDIEALWNALAQGSIDILASDHAPHLLEEKKAEIVWEVKPGFPNLETIVPLVLTQINKDRLKISDLIRLMAENPARIFHLNERGCLAKGCHADVTIVDMHKEYRIDASKFQSKAKYSPFDGWKVKGKPIKTLVNGRLVMDDDEVIAKPGTGQIFRGKH